MITKEFLTEEELDYKEALIAFINLGDFDETLYRKITGDTSDVIDEYAKEASVLEMRNLHPLLLVEEDFKNLTVEQVANLGEIINANIRSRMGRLRGFTTNEEIRRYDPHWRLL